MINNGTYLDIILAIVIAGILSFLATPIVKHFAASVGAMDVPSEARRVHDHPIPRLGGLAIFIAFLVAVVLFANITKQVRGILLGALVVVVLGVIDDITPLPALLKFVVQIGAALIAVYHGVVIEVLSNPLVMSATEYLKFGSLAIPITVLWIVAITNSVNLIDGLDGLAVGVSAIASVMMLVISLIVSEHNVAVILAALVGACVGFMPYNINPAKIFMGDTGALLLGFVLATVSIIGLFKFYAVISFAVPFLVLGLPLFDTGFAFFRRLIHGQNPMKPDRGHFHHRLLDKGFSQKQAVAILYVIAAVLGLAAVVITTGGEMRAIIFVIAFCILGAIMAAIMRKHKKIQEQENSEEQDASEKDKEEK